MCLLPVTVEAKTVILLKNGGVNLVSKLIKNSINVYHFGYFKEPKLSENKRFYHNLTNLIFLIKLKFL